MSLCFTSPLRYDCVHWSNKCVEQYGHTADHSHKVSWSQILYPRCEYFRYLTFFYNPTRYFSINLSPSFLFDLTLWKTKYSQRIIYLSFEIDNVYTIILISCYILHLSSEYIIVLNHVSKLKTSENTDNKTIISKQISGNISILSINHVCNSSHVS